MNDPIADLLTRIRNAGSALHADVVIPHSKMKESIAHILKREGYISSVSVEGATVKTLKLGLRYQGRKTVITGLKQVSTPGLRRYCSSTEIPRVLGGMGVAILSTPQGVMTDRKARAAGIGGEVIAYVA